MSGNPKSKSKSKIQTAAFGAATKRKETTTIQNPKSKIQNPKSKIQNPRSKIQNPKIQDPKSKLQTARLDFGVWICFGRDGAERGGYVSSAFVLAGWPSEFGVVGGTQACNRKVAGSIPQIGHRFSAEGLCWKPSPDFRPRVGEIGAQFPEKLRARWRCSKR